MFVGIRKLKRYNTNYIANRSINAAVIDGPNLIERIFGIDSGVKSGWSIVSAGYMGMKGAISTAKGLDSIANSIKNSAIGGGSMALGNLLKRI